jgi:cytosine/uracil/thiamine/allantoin permease
VAIATIATTIATNVVRRANDFANCAPRLIRFKRVT